MTHVDRPSLVAPVTPTGTSSISLRLSVTERCNLACSYCRNRTTTAHKQALSRVELTELVLGIHNFVTIRKLRLTGGEPLVRTDLIPLATSLRQQLPYAELCLTTNGVLLGRYAFDLARAGVDRINISLDSLDPSRFTTLTGKNAMSEIFSGIEAARQAGFRRLKINTVLLRSVNAENLVDLVRRAQELDCEVRFIELMPIGVAAQIFADEFLPCEQAIEMLSQTFTYVGAANSSDTARRHRFDDGGNEVVVGFIPSVSRPFCSTCDRIRVDSQGHIYTCLKSRSGVDLVKPLRNNDWPTFNRQLERVLVAHNGATTGWPLRSMATIGG